MSVVMTICDVGDEVIIFTPYYFNHLMALQLINAKVSGSSIFITGVQFYTIVTHTHTHTTHTTHTHHTHTHTHECRLCWRRADRMT
jgi:hypothetical protein